MKVVEFAGKTCDRFQRLLHSYVNNELSVETTHEVLKHLERFSRNVNLLIPVGFFLSAAAVGAVD